MSILIPTFRGLPRRRAKKVSTEEAMRDLPEVQHDLSGVFVAILGTQHAEYRYCASSLDTLF